MATVPLQQTPTENIQVGQAPLFSPTNIQPVQDTGVAEDIGRLSKAQKQFADIALQLQDERDDAKVTETVSEYQKEADKLLLDYTSLLEGQAVASVGKDDNGDDITAYDKYILDRTGLQEKFLENLENRNQREIYNNQVVALSRISTNKASKHSIEQQRRYADNMAKAKVQNLINETALFSGDFANNDSDYAILFGSVMQQVKVLAKQKGYQMFDSEVEGSYDSDQYIYLRDQYLNQLHDQTLKILVEENVRKADQYLNFHLDQGTVTAKILSKYSKVIETALNKENGQNIGKNIANFKGNPNDGNMLTAVSFISMLPSNNTRTTSNGFPYVEGLNQEMHIENLNQELINSQFANLPNEHRTPFIYIATKIGVDNAGSVFNKAKKNLKEQGLTIDTARMKTDSQYAVEINTKIMQQVNAIAKEKFSKVYTNQDDLELINKDLDVVVKTIDYTYAESQKPLFRVDENKVILEEDAKKFARTTNTEKNLLERVEAEIKSNISEQTRFAKDNYNQLLEKVRKIAYAKPSGWQDIEATDWNQLKFSDQENLIKGFSKTDDMDTIIAYEQGTLLQENETIDDYRHLMTESTYKKYKLDESSASNDNRSTSADGIMFDDTLITYGFDTIFSKKKGNRNTGETDLDKKKDYIQLKAEWKKRINQFLIDNKKKPTNKEKQNILNEILNDKVYVKTPWFKQHIQIPAEALDDDQFKDAFVFVGSEKIFTKQIPDEVREYFIKGYVAAGMSYTEQMIGNEWILHGKKKKKSEIIKYAEDNNL